MTRTLCFSVAPGEDGWTVKRLLQTKGCTAAVLTLLKKTADGLLLNERPVFVTARVAIGDRLTLCLSDEGDSALPERLDVPVCFEDDDLIVYDKPAGMAVHPTKKIQSGTLANDFAFRAGESGEHAVFRPVFRLDRGTTGLVVVAKHKLACALLEGRIAKEYLCLCEGELPQRGTYDGPIGLAEVGRLRREVRPDGQPAVTHFERLDGGDGWSLARVWLETGRTHQIRCHFADAGHPLLGDFLYGTETPDWGRHALHCVSLRFTHPITGQLIRCESPLPADMADFIKNSR